MTSIASLDEGQGLKYATNLVAFGFCCGLLRSRVASQVVLILLLWAQHGLYSCDALDNAFAA